VSRALRRHHTARLKKNRANYQRSWTCEGQDPKRLARLVQTPCNCSCFMCGNPRSYFGNSEAAKTLQELSDLEAVKKYGE
jgi:hypothetical protein